MPDEAARREWEKPENWSAGPLPLYFARRDPRLWVPKRRPGFGWTVNMAHRHAGLLLLALLIVPLLLVALAAEYGGACPAS